MSQFIISLKSRNISEKDITHIIGSFKKINKKIFSKFNHNCSIFDIVQDNISIFENIYTRNKIIEKKENYVQPVEYQLGFRMEFKKKDLNQILVKKNETYQYISIRETLLCILKSKEIRNEIQNINYGCDFIPTNFKNQFWSSKNTIKLLLYFDELEIKNPLGKSNSYFIYNYLYN